MLQYLNYHLVMKMLKYIFLVVIVVLAIFLAMGYFASPESVKKSAQISELEKICSGALSDASPQDRARLREICDVAKTRIKETSGVSNCEDLILQKKRALKLGNADGAKLYDDEFKSKCEGAK